MQKFRETVDSSLWNFQDFSATLILREINFNHFEAPKPAILTILPAVNFEFQKIFDILKCETPKRQNSKPQKLLKMAVFDLLKSAIIDFT